MLKISFKIAASWLLPGSGQAINNEWGKGIGFFALSVFGPMVLGALTGVSMFAFSKKNIKSATSAGITSIIASRNRRQNLGLCRCR